MVEIYFLTTIATFDFKIYLTSIVKKLKKVYSEARIGRFLNRNLLSFSQNMATPDEHRTL